MSLFGTGVISPSRRRSSLGLDLQKPGGVSFGFFDKRDSLGLPQPTVAGGTTGGVDWKRRRSSGLGFWHDVVEADDDQIAQVPPGTSPKTRKRRKIEDVSDYGKIKLGDVRRKQLKTAISDACKKSLEARDRVLQIGKIKEAAIGDLFRMADACGILDFALSLADDRLTQKHSAAVYRKGQTLVDMSNAPGRAKRRRRRVEAMLLSSEDERVVEPAIVKRVRPLTKKRVVGPPRFLEPVPGVGEYDVTKYSDFASPEPRTRASPTLVMKPEMPTHNSAPVGAYDVPPPPKSTRHWSFGKPGKNLGRPVPVEVIFMSSSALEMATVRMNPGPDTYDIEVSKDKRMGVFTVDKRDKVKKLKEPPIGPGDYMKDINFIKSDRSAVLNVVGRVESELPFRRKHAPSCDRLTKAEVKAAESKHTWGLTSSSWATSPKAGIFSGSDAGPGFVYGKVKTWFPSDKVKSVTTMRPVSADDRFAVHRMGHLSDRIWGPF